jgi:anti-sigma-K factor RskA
MNDDDDILAAEFAIGLLDDAGARDVQARARTDATLSLRIAWWRDQLAPLAGEAETPPPDHVWGRINAAIPGNDNPVSAARPWQWATGGMGLVAAGLLGIVVMRPPAPAPLAPAAPMVAALAGEKGAVVAASYDATTGKLVIAPTLLDPGKGDAELWIIPEGGQAVSLGVVNAKATETHNVPTERRALMQPGATFAITQEAKGGSPTGQAQGPIIAAGKIIRT